MKNEYFRQIFEIYPNFKFNENPSSGSQVVPCGRTDRQDKANSQSLCTILRTRLKILGGEYIA